MKLVFGEQQIPRPVVHQNDADTIRGPAWRASREADSYHLEYATGDHAGNDRRFGISAEEFDRLRTDPDQFEPIIHAHGG